jgi:hypothetical protein
MIEIDTVRAIALSLPEVEDRSDARMLHFYVRGRHFAWTYLERTAAKKSRQPRLDVLVVRCAAEAKEVFLAAEPGKLFTTDHYRGFPAVLVRLDKVNLGELRELLTAAWRCQAPRSLAKRLEQPTGRTARARPGSL